MARGSDQRVGEEVIGQGAEGYRHFCGGIVTGISGCLRCQVSGGLGIEVSVGLLLDIGAGRELIREGQVGREFFLVVDGEAEVTRDGEHLATLGPGTFFGETALLIDGPRTATVKGSIKLDPPKHMLNKQSI
jgi:hypothetical protein